MANDKVLIAGGDTTNNSADLYDSASNSFAAPPILMNEARERATATLLPNGKVLTAGGKNASGILSSVELYDPATNSFAPAASLPMMNQGRFEATATPLLDGRVLIAGGQGVNGPTNSVELYTQ